MTLDQDFIPFPYFSHADHSAELDKIRQLLQSGLSLGELFSTGLGHFCFISNP